MPSVPQHISRIAPRSEDPSSKLTPGIATVPATLSHPPPAGLRRPFPKGNTMERSILGGVKLRVPVGGRIRAGMKILKRAAAEKPLARKIYDEGLAQGLGFDEIDARLEKEANEKGALIPCNAPWFTVR